MKQISKAIAVLLAMVFVFQFTPAVKAQIHSESTFVKTDQARYAAADDIKSLLNDYSSQLGSKEVSLGDSYSPAMASLVLERQEYYSQFYKEGLNLNLTSIKSSFVVEDSEISQKDGVTHVKVMESVTMFGYPVIKQAEEYPLVAAADWAISKSDNKVVLEELKQYIAVTTASTNESISNGVEITFRVHHNIEVINTAGRPQIIKDEFTDKEIDNGEGFDNVDWVDGKFIRRLPDFTSMLEFKIYDTPIDILGQQLLDDYTNAYNTSHSTNSTRYSGSFSYDRTAAQNYALSHVNPNAYTTCSYNGQSILMDTSYYGPLYQSVWSYTTTTCDDCASYVSQALRAGGFLSDSNWNSSGNGTYGWRVFDLSSGSPPGIGLAYYLRYTKQAIDVYTTPSSLLIGDLMYTDLGHVVIVTGTNPLRFSGHTNDRRNYPHVSSLNHYWHIKSSFPQTYIFQDVPPTTNWAWQEIERLYNSGITGGCSNNPLKYCPADNVTRAQMAVFLLRGIHGAAYTPPAVGSSTGFVDVATDYWAAAWIKQLYAEGITGGCAAGYYCPDNNVTHAQMAVFLLRSKHTASYVPPAVGSSSGFYDVDTGYWAAAWIKQLALVENISYGAHGCSPY
jgi:hypothetical protein